MLDAGNSNPALQIQFLLHFPGRHLPSFIGVGKVATPNSMSHCKDHDVEALRRAGAQAERDCHPLPQPRAGVSLKSIYFRKSSKKKWSFIKLNRNRLDLE